MFNRKLPLQTGGVVVFHQNTSARWSWGGGNVSKDDERVTGGGRGMKERHSVCGEVAKEGWKGGWRGERWRGGKMRC